MINGRICLLSVRSFASFFSLVCVIPIFLWIGLVCGTARDRP
jgi:hypothetical protein